MDRELSSTELRKRQLNIVLKISMGIFVIILALFGLRTLLSSRVERSTILTAIAESGAMEGSITASGTVIPAYEQILTSPFPSRIDSLYKQPGTLVTSGDAILKLNNEFMILQKQRNQDELKLMQNNKHQLQLKMERALIKIQSDYDIMELKVKSFQNDLATQERIFQLGGGMKNSVDRAQLNLDIGKLELEQLKQRKKNEDKSLLADLIDLELRLSIKQNELTQLERKLDLALTKAEFKGVVTWVNDTPGASVQQGETVARVADLSHFKIRGSISDYHADKLVTENPVYITITNQRLDGVISTIEPTSMNGIITFYVELKKDSDPNLRSNLRTDINIITTTKPNVIRLKNGPALNGHGSMYLYVIDNEIAFRKAVIVGESNLNYVEIVSGIKPGEEVIISDIERFRNLKKIRVK